VAEIQPVYARRPNRPGRCNGVAANRCDLIETSAKIVEARPL